MNSTPMTLSEINTNDFDAFGSYSMPSRYSKHQTAFGKYAASHAAAQTHWNSENSALQSNSPLTPSVGFGMDYNDPLGAIKPEMLTPESAHTLSPHELFNTMDFHGNSPLFDGVDIGDMKSWESLFLDEEPEPIGKPVPEAQSPTECLDAKVKVEESPTIVEGIDTAKSSNASPSDLNFSVLDCKDMPAPKATTGGAITKDPRRKVDDLGITVYKRKPRTTPLRPITVPEDGDNTLAKRAKNTEAARRSRARKLERMSQLEDRVRQLLEENESLRSEIKNLRKSQV